MSEPTINKENSIKLLTQYIDLAQQKGAFLLQEASVLKKAVDFFNPDVKKKPSFGEVGQDPEIIAITLLLRGVQRGQAHGNAYNLADAAMIWDITEFWIKEGGKAVSEGVNIDKKAKKDESSSSNSRKAQVEKDDDEDDDEDEVTPITVNKGKGRA